MQWADWAYREAFQIQAYIAAGSGDMEKALALLGRVETLGPYEAAPRIVFTGLWMWKGHLAMRLFKKSPPNAQSEQVH